MAESAVFERVRVPLWCVPVALGVIGFFVSVAFSWVPSIWYDEAATIHSAQRSWSELFALVHNVDAVHAFYYAIMHLWFDVVGYSPFTLRLPSAAAVGVSTALIVLLARRLASNRVSILTGIVFLLLPRVTWMGVEGRSYSLTVTVSILLSLVFVTALSRSVTPGRSRVLWWAVYFIVAAIAVTLFIYLALIVVGHGVSALWNAMRARRGQGVRFPGLRRPSVWSGVIGWVSAAGAACFAVLPVVLEAVGQSGQVSWIQPLGASLPRGILVSQWFLDNDDFALFAWILVGIAVVVLCVRWSRVRMSPSEEAVVGTPRPSLLSLVLPMMIIPTLVLVTASFVASPLYTPRYVTAAVAGVAILMAVAIDSLGRRWLMVLAVAALVALAGPEYLAQRESDAKPDGAHGSAWGQVAAFISSNRNTADSRGARAPHEAVIYGPARGHPSATTRVIAYSYPAAFAGLVDLTLDTARSTGPVNLWESHYPLSVVVQQPRLASRFAGVEVIWLVTSDLTDNSGTTSELLSRGYVPDGRWAFPSVSVVRYRAG